MFHMSLSQVTTYFSLPKPAGGAVLVLREVRELDLLSFGCTGEVWCPIALSSGEPYRMLTVGGFGRLGVGPNKLLKLFTQRIGSTVSRMKWLLILNNLLIMFIDKSTVKSSAIF